MTHLPVTAIIPGAAGEMTLKFYRSNQHINVGRIKPPTQASGAALNADGTTLVSS